MAVKLTREFVNDLREAEDAKFVRHVLNHTIAKDGSFTFDRDDHRYDGIKDAWIRYVSRGNTAFRVIYIRKGDDVLLYRAGRHSVESAVVAPSALVTLPIAPTGSLEASPSTQKEGQPPLLLKTTEPTFLHRYLLSMYHLRHKEISIVSPFIDLSLLESRHHFGGFLDKAIEEGTRVSLITSPPTVEALPAFRNCQERNIDVFFLARLHTKLYFFDIDLNARSTYQALVEARPILGSSNMTKAGTGMDDVAPNEELCCVLPSSVCDDIRTYITRLAMAADDFTKYAFKLARSNKL